MDASQTIFEILKEIVFFNGLKDSELKKISKDFIKETFLMGDQISVGEEQLSDIRILINGEARQIVEHPETKKTLTLNIESPISFIGLNSSSGKNPCVFISAATDCVFLKIKVKRWDLILKKFPNILINLNDKLIPSSIWEIIKNRSDLEIPEKSKDLKKWIRIVTEKSSSITIFNDKNVVKNLDDSKEWFLASMVNQYMPGSILKDNLLNKIISDEKPIKIIGLPKNLFLKKVEDQIKDDSLINKRKVPNISQIEGTKLSQVKNNLLIDTSNNRKEQKYKFYGSSDNKIDEAVACFRTIGDIFDLPLKVDIIKRTILKNLEEDADEVSLNLCAAISESIGLKTQILELPANLLHRVETPALIKFENNELAVILEIKKENLLISRPKVELKTYKKSQLLEFCPNDKKFPILILQTTERTPKRKFGLKWFLPAIKKNKRSLIEVLIASVFVQIFQLMNPLIIQQIIDNVLGRGAVGTLPILATLLFVFAIFENILTAVRTNLFIDTTNRIDISLGEQVIDHLLRLPLSFFDKRPVGELSSRLSELEQIRNFLTSTSLTVVLDSIFSVVYIAVMLLYSWVLTIVSLLVAPILALLTFSVSPIIRRQLRTKAELNAKTQNHLVEVLTGIQTVKAQNFEVKARWKWKDRYTRYITESFKNAITSTSYNSLTQLLNQFSSLGVLCVGTFLVIQGSLTLGELIAFRIISGYVTGPLLRLSNLYQNFQQTNISIERVSEIINTPQESTEKDSLNIPMPKIDGKIKLDNLSFSFLEKGPLNLSKVNLDIASGKFVAIVGESGSGKSTLTKLIARLYEPQGGKILIDNIDISKVELSSLRSQIGIVPQDSILFDGTVQENISLTNTEASSEEIIAAAKIACANEFVMNLPTGYSSDVGERGSNLSGGQRQRIAIARSILQNPNLLIMDESTSALDYQTESKVSLNLMEFFRGKTVLFVTHRLNSIIHSDIIVMMHKGKIEEQGTHSELMALKGRYYSLYKQQEKYSDE